jgi:cytochrome c-type biogenesis protein CcmF
VADLGRFAVLLACAAGVWAVVTSVTGARLGRPDLVASGEGGVAAAALGITCGAGALLWLLVTGDFSLAYIVEYTDRALPLAYRVGALWAGQEGSLLLWTWMVCLVSMGVILRARHRGEPISPVATAVLASTIVLFAVLTAFVENPFQRLPVAADDGQGLNPLLQDYSQLIHPITLYAGFVAFTVPFALVVGGLADGGRPGPWTRQAEVWNLWAWVALTAGIVLGARWAYVELGWGGYWAWDPVENTSLLPWLTSTAVLHTGVAHRRTGRPRLAGVVLVAVTFALCLFGTFLTRSGVVSSVHAFGTSGLGPLLGGAVLLTLALAGALVAWRLPQLWRTGEGMTRVRRALIWLLGALTLVVLAGTVYPLFSRALTGTEVAVQQAYFQQTVMPLGALLLAVFALAPLATATGQGRRLRPLVTRAVAFAVPAVALAVLPETVHWDVVIVVGLAAAALVTVVERAWVRGRSAGDAVRGRPLGVRVVAVLHDTGPYLAHVGLIAVIAAAMVNGGYQRQGTVTLRVGEASVVAGEQVRLADLRGEPGADRMTFVADVALGEPDAATTVQARQVLFAGRDQPHAEVGIDSGLLRDRYLVLESADLEQGVASVSVTVNPAVFWIWVAGALLIAGGLATALPRQRARRVGEPRTDPVSSVAAVGPGGAP